MICSISFDHLGHNCVLVVLSRSNMSRESKAEKWDVQKVNAETIRLPHYTLSPRRKQKTRSENAHLAVLWFIIELTQGKGFNVLHCCTSKLFYMFATLHQSASYKISENSGQRSWDGDEGGRVLDRVWIMEWSILFLLLLRSLQCSTMQQKQTNVDWWIKVRVR